MPPEQSPTPQPEPFNFWETDPKKNFAPWFLKFILILIAAGLGAIGALWQLSYNNYQYGVTALEQSEQQIQAVKQQRLASPSTSSGQSVVTTDWQTYRNEEYRIEFKYPYNWHILGGTKQVPIIISSTGKPAVNNGPGEEIIIYEDKTHEVDSNSKYQDTINQILSTFKFIELIPIGWKTYRDEEFGFEFKYPATFTSSIKSSGSSTRILINPPLKVERELGSMSVEINPLGLGFGEGCEDVKTTTKVINSINIQRSDYCGLIVHKFTHDNDQYLTFIDSGSFDENVYDQILSTFKFIQ